MQSRKEMKKGEGKAISEMVLTAFTDVNNFPHIQNVFMDLSQSTRLTNICTLEND